MNTIEKTLIDKIQRLPPEELAQVESFVDFLASKQLRDAALERLLAIAPALETAGVTPMSEAELAVEVKAARIERRMRSGR